MPTPFGIQSGFPSLLRRILNAPALRALIVLSIVLASCYQYGRTHFYRDPGSRFYDESRAHDRRYSAWREVQAQDYLKVVAEKTAANKLDADEFIKGDTNATLCASFLTVPRPGTEPYLDASIASALHGLMPVERRAMHLSVFFATTAPEDHSTFQQPWLRNVVDEVFTYESMLSPSDLDHVRDLEDANDGLRKAPYDYTLPLRHCEDTRAKYFAVFEDDIILADGWLARTLHGIKQMEKELKAHGRTNDWLYMRLFNEERSTTWPSKEIGANHEAKLSFWIGLGISVSLLLLRRRSKVLRAHLDNLTLLILFLLTPAFVVLFFQCGKASLLPAAPGVREETPGCCSQALVFNRYHIDQLVEFLYMRRHLGFHDSIVRDYAKMHTFAQYSQYPMMAQHVGSHSMIKKLFSPHAWSMAFEDLSPFRLAREHGEYVREVFGDWAVT